MARDEQLIEIEKDGSAEYTPQVGLYSVVVHVSSTVVRLGTGYFHLFSSCAAVHVLKVAPAPAILAQLGCLREYKFKMPGEAATWRAKELLMLLLFFGNWLASCLH